MPWHEVHLPPLAGVHRGLSIDRSPVVLTDAGLFRYEVETYPAVRLLHPAARASEKLDRQTGKIGWCASTYQLYGDPDFLPAPPSDQLATATEDGHSLRLDARKRTAQLVDPDGEVVFTVEGFPAGGRWSVASFVGWQNYVLLADDTRVRLFHYTEPPASPHARWEQAGVGSDHAALLAGVLDHPDDDAARLVYADWLEENGAEPRAEFIRLQCQHAELQRKGPVGQTKLTKRIDALLAEHDTTWRYENNRVAGVRWWDGFWRGFLIHTVSSPVTLVRAAKGLGKFTPVEAVQLRESSESAIAPLVRSPVLERLRWIHIRCASGDSSGLRHLVASPRVTQLRLLTGTVADDPLVRAIAGSPHLTSLEHIDLTHAQVTEAGLAVLAESEGLPAVRWVDLRGVKAKAGVVTKLKKRFGTVLV